MSFATKADLQASIGNWLARTDLTAYYDDFVQLAEVRLNSETRLRLLEANTTLTGVVSSASLTLPTDFSDPVGLQILDSTTIGANYFQLLPQTFDEMQTYTSSGRPCAWAVTGSTITLDRPCDQAYSFLFRYNQTFSLASAGSTNSLLTSYPDVYLAACMIEACAFVKDPQAAASWNQKLSASLDLLDMRELASKKKAVLVSDPGLMYNNRNYYRRGGWYF